VALQDHIEAPTETEETLVVGSKRMATRKVNQIIQRMQKEIVMRDVRLFLVLYHGVIARGEIEKWCGKVLELELIEAKVYC
jgi:hypothetical protein